MKDAFEAVFIFLCAVTLLITLSVARYLVQEW